MAVDSCGGLYGHMDVRICVYQLCGWWMVSVQIDF